MATPPSPVNLSFGAGIDESQHGDILDPLAGFAVLENVRRDGRGALQKRRGFSALSALRLDGTSRTSGERLFAHGEQICVLDGTQIDVWSATAGRSIGRDRLPEPTVRRRPLQFPGGNPLRQDTIAVNGYVVTAALFQSGSPHVVVSSVLDASTFAVLRPAEQIATQSPISYVLLAAIGTKAFVVYPGGGTPKIYALTLDLSTPASIAAGWVGPTELATATGFGQGFDVATTSSRLFVAYGTGSGTNRLAVLAFDASLTPAGSTTIPTASASPTGLGTGAQDGGPLWVSWTVGVTSVHVIALDASSLAALATSIQIAATSAYNIAPVPDGTDHVRVYFTAAANHAVSSQGVALAAGALSTTLPALTSWPNVTLAARPFVVAGRVYACVLTGESAIVPPPYAEHACVDLGTLAAPAVAPLRAVAAFSPRLTRIKLLAGQIAHLAQISATQIATINQIATSGTVDAVVGTTAELEVLDFDDDRRWQHAYLGAVSYLSGGVLSSFAGANAFEAGFIVRPSKPTFTLAAGSGTRSDLRYVAIYEWVDALGNVHWSGVSDPSAAATLVSQDATVSTATLGVTSRRDVRIAFYRSDGGAIYRRLGVVANDPTVATVSIVDTGGSIASNAPLYRQPGTLGTAQDRSSPPSLSLITTYNGMLVGVADDGITLWHSGQYVPGEGLWFSDVFQASVQEAGDITALAAQDGTLFVFKTSAIFAVTGEPPSDNGASGGLGVPRRLACDVGCIEPRSVVVTEIGIFFQSERGIEVLTRSQSVEWVGERVQSTVSAFPVCASATLDRRSSTVSFELRAEEDPTSEGRALVFDLATRVWTSADRRRNESGRADCAAVSAAIVPTSAGDRYAWLDAEGVVHVEDDASWMDLGHWVTMRAETAWFKAGGIQGQQIANRALVLATRHTKHDLAFAASYNYAAAATTSQTWTDGTLASLVDVWPRQQIEHPLGDDADTQSLKIALTDAWPTGTAPETAPSALAYGRGATWIALTIDITPRPGTARLPEGSR